MVLTPTSYYRVIVTIRSFKRWNREDKLNDKYKGKKYGDLTVFDKANDSNPDL